MSILEDIVKVAKGAEELMDDVKKDLDIERIYITSKIKGTINIKLLENFPKDGQVFLDQLVADVKLFKTGKKLKKVIHKIKKGEATFADIPRFIEDVTGIAEFVEHGKNLGKDKKAEFDVKENQEISYKLKDLFENLTIFAEMWLEAPFGNAQHYCLAGKFAKNVIGYPRFEIRINGLFYWSWAKHYWEIGAEWTLIPDLDVVSED